MLYGKNVNVEEMDDRFLSLSSNHKVLFGKDNPMIFSASGRTEIAGNHTDHNLGLVIGAAINLDTIAAVTKRDDMVINFCSEGFPKCTIDISDLEIKEEEKNTTASLLRGVAKAFKDRGFDIKGFDANVTSKVLRGLIYRCRSFRQYQECPALAHPKTLHLRSSPFHMQRSHPRSSPVRKLSGLHL